MTDTIEILKDDETNKTEDCQIKFSSNDLDFRVASRLVIDAKDLRNILFKHTHRDLNSYDYYLNKWLTYFTYTVIITHLIILPLFEYPAYYKEIPFWMPCVIETFCLIVYLVRWLHLKSFQSEKDFYGDKKHILVLVIITLSLVDLFAYTVVRVFMIPFAHRYTRWLRVLFYINFNEGKELRRAFRNVRRTLPDILNVFVLYISSLIVFSFLAWQIFKRKSLTYPNGQEYFARFEDALWDMYVSVTTANFPDVMMPAYELNGVYAIFFIVFMIINLYLFINIILASIYTNYKKHLKQEVKSTIQLKRSKLEMAFNLIKQHSNTNGSNTKAYNGVTFSLFERLMKCIDAQKTRSQVKTLFELLDFNRDGVLDLKEFLYFADLLNVKISEVKDREQLMQKLFPKLYNSHFSLFVQRIVRHKFFAIPFDLLILLNVIFILFSINQAEWFFLSVFIFEILIKLYAFGVRQFFSRYWNIFDLVIISTGLILGIVEATTNFGNKGEVLEIILILRLLRLLKLISSIKRFRVVITTIMNITPSLLTYASLIFTIYYVYAMIGMEIFGDKIKSKSTSSKHIDCSNPALNNTEFAKLRYCKNNFENVLQAFVLMFELMVVNQWHVLSQGFITVTTKWSRLFFVAFHISCVIVSLNIFTAFVLEAFLLEYETTEKTLFETRIEERIIELGLSLNDPKKDKTPELPIAPHKSGYHLIEKIFEAYEKERPIDMSKVEGLKFHINPKGPKSVEVLLQRMFSNEFDITQDELLIE